MSDYDIIIPHYGLNHALSLLCARCLRSIRLHSVRMSYHVILVDNGSPLFEDLRGELTALHRRVTVIRNTKNLGFVLAVNQGLALSTAPYIVIMNNDTEAAPAWLSRLSEPLRDDVGLCGPRTTTLGSWQGRYGKQLRTPWILPNNNDSMLAFFCVMLTRQVFEKIGYLDESFGIGFADDSDYCRRARNAGFKLALQTALVIPHHHRTTFHTLFGKQGSREMQQEAIRKFQAKWGSA